MKLYEDIRLLLPQLHGWCEVPKAVGLVNLVLAIQPAVVLEGGVWGGRSFFPMAMAMKHLHQTTGHRGKVIGIDPWNNDASVEGQTTEADKKWWGDMNHELVYQHFIYHLDNLGLKAICEIHRVKTDDYDPPGRIDIFHNDGNHGAQSLSDTIKFAPRIPVGGFCILDDIGWNGGFVGKAAEWLLKNGFVEIHPLGTGAVFLRSTAVA